MKRDMELIRKILLQLESLDTRRGGIVHISLLEDEPRQLNLPEYTAHEIEYHARLLVTAGLIDEGGSGAMDGFMFRGFTWEGHDFIDAIRDDAIWEKTKKGATEVGGVTFELLKDLAKGFIKKQIQDKTGISI